MTYGALPQGKAGQYFATIAIIVIGRVSGHGSLRIECRHAQQLAAQGELVFAVTVAEKAVSAYFQLISSGLLAPPARSADAVTRFMRLKIPILLNG